MRTSGRPAEHVDLDHGDWVEDPPRRARSGGDRRATERRGSAGQAPARERRSGERRANERRSSASAAAPTTRAAATQPARRTQPSSARPPAAVLGPGVAERRTLMLVTFLLVVYGLVMAYSASAAQAYFEHGSSFYLFGRQVVWVVHRRGRHVRCSRASTTPGSARPPSRSPGSPSPAWPSCSCRASAAPSTAPAAGSTSAARVVQPSEFAKLACVVLVATLIVARPREVLTLKGFLRLAIIGIVPAAALIMLEPDLGTTLVLVTAVVARARRGRRAAPVSVRPRRRRLSSPSSCSSPSSRTGWSG